MADLFDNYEEDFLESKKNIEARISTIPSLDGGKRDSEIQQAESDIQEMEQIVKSMNLSARNVVSNQGRLSKIREYEGEIGKIKTSLRKATMQLRATSDRDNLFAGGLRNEHMVGSMDQRERLLSATEKLDRSNVELRQAMATAEETVSIGIEVMQNLENQRGVMYQIKDKLGSVNDNLSRAKRIMSTMARRVVTNKLIMAIIILVLVLAICLIIYIKFFSGTATDTTSTDMTTTAAPSPTS